VRLYKLVGLSLDGRTNKSTVLEAANDLKAIADAAKHMTEKSASYQLKEGGRLVREWSR
jgi:hypothetical protein